MQYSSKRILVGSLGSSTAFGVIGGLSVAFPDSAILIGMDSNPAHLVAGASFVSAFEQVPLASEPSFSTCVRELILRHNIDFYIPIHDSEILAAAIMRDAAGWPASCKLLAPSRQAIESCNDKLQTYIRCKDAGINTPFTANIDSVDSFSERSGDWIAKPRFGVGSRGVVRFAGADWPQLRERIDFSSEPYVVQEACRAPEITVDVFCSRHTSTVYALSRERLETKAGVCSKARIFRDQYHNALAAQLAGALSIDGAFNFQVMKDENDQISVIDINPRTGGATAMGRVVGVNFAAANLADAAGWPSDHLLPGIQGQHFVMRQFADFLTASM